MVSGAYSLERKIGAGAYAEVFLAKREGRTVVVKRARAERLDHIGVTGGVFFAEGKRFATGSVGAWTPSPEEVLADEARVLERVTHPAMVKLIEAARDHLVLEHIEGSTWRELMHAGRVTKAHFVALVTALAEMGEQHGDLKPENVMIDAGGRVRIIDPTSGSTKRDAYGNVESMITTLWYNPTLRASDVPALGLMLHEIVTGQHLLIDTGAPLTATDRLREALGKLESTGRGKWFSRVLNMQRSADAKTEAMILRCLGLRFENGALDLGDTYASVSELKAALA